MWRRWLAFARSEPLVVGDTQAAAPQAETWQTQLTGIGMGFLSKRLATVTLGSIVVTFKTLSEPQMWAIVSMACCAMLCFTWEQVSAKAK